MYISVVEAIILLVIGYYAISKHSPYDDELDPCSENELFGSICKLIHDKKVESIRQENHTRAIEQSIQDLTTKIQTLQNTFKQEKLESQRKFQDLQTEHQARTTCWKIKQGNPHAASGIYTIYLPSGSHNAYCEMGINGGGYTFLSNRMFERLTQADIDVLFEQRYDVLLRISRPDATQPYTVIKHPENKPITISWNQNFDFVTPINHFIGSYLYMSFYSLAQITSSLKQFGFISNDKKLLYNRNNGELNYFAFFSNPKEIKPSPYHSNLIFENKYLAVDWRSSAKQPYSARGMPLDFFLLTEAHFAFAVYTSSDRWLKAKSPALGTAIGLR